VIRLGASPQLAPRHWLHRLSVNRVVDRAPLIEFAADLLENVGCEGLTNSIDGSFKGSVGLSLPGVRDGAEIRKKWRRR
jgi:hypothetical protein